MTLNIQRCLAVALGAILVWLVTTAWSPDEWPWNLAEAAIFLLLLITAAFVYLGKLRPRFTWIIVPFLLIPAWGTLQIAFGVSVYCYATWTSVLAWVSFAAFLWIALHAFACPEHARVFRAAVVMFGVLVALESTLQKFALNGHLLSRPGIQFVGSAMGPFLNYDHYAAFIELVLPLGLWSAWQDRERRLAWLGAAAILYGSVIAGASRAGSALVTIEVLVMLLFVFRYETKREHRERLAFSSWRRLQSRPLWFASAVLGLLLIASATVGWDVLLKRFREDDPFAFRREILAVSTRMIKARPLTGFGLGTWPTVYPAYSDYDAIAVVNHAHNDWAEWTADGGLPCAMLLSLVAARAAWLSMGAPWGIGILSVFAHSLVDFPLQRPTLVISLLLVFGCLEAACAAKRPDTGIYELG